MPVPEIVLSQHEADQLLAMEKHRADEDRRDFPSLGGRVTAPLVSVDGRERFLLDVSRGRIDRAKLKYQVRCRSVVTLARLDVGGPSHRNPDDAELPCPHLHVYREGFGDKWAIPVDPNHFPNITDTWLLLEEFQAYCNIAKPPLIERGLFT